MKRLTGIATVGALLAIVRPALAHPQTFDELTFKVEDFSGKESTKLVLKPTRDFTLARTLDGKTSGSISNRATDAEFAAIRTAFAQAHVATLPVVAVQPAADVRIFTLTTRTGSRTYSYTATTGSEPTRVKPLVKALRDVVDRFFLPVSRESVQVSGKIFATFGTPLPGHNFPIAIDVKGHGLTVTNEPFATLIEKEISPNLSASSSEITVAGRVGDAPGLGLKTYGIQVEWVLAVARRDLIVRTAQFPSASVNPRTQVKKGDVFKIVNVLNGYYWLQKLDAALDYSFVKADDGVRLTTTEPPAPHVHGTIELRGGRIGVATRDGAFAIRLGRGSMTAHYWDELLDPVQGKAVTLLGGVDASGQWADVDAILGTTTVDLPVRVSPDDSAALNTFTGGPSGTLARGTQLKILGRRGAWVQIQLLSGPASGDGYAFVKLAGLRYSDASTSTQNARQIATRLGDLLGTRLKDAGVFQIPTIKGDLATFRLPFERAFGPALAKQTDAASNTTHGGKIVVKAQTQEIADRTADGHPVVVLYGLWGASQGFFYQPTVIDTTTGEVYQGKSSAAAGAGPLTFFGPLKPSADARLVGVTKAEFVPLESILRARVQSFSGP